MAETESGGRGTADTVRDSSLTRPTKVIEIGLTKLGLQDVITKQIINSFQMIVFTMEVNVTSACLYSASVIIRFLHSIDYQKKVKMSKSTLLHPKSAFNLPYKTLFYRYHRKIQISETDCKT